VFEQQEKQGGREENSQEREDAIVAEAAHLDGGAALICENARTERSRGAVVLRGMNRREIPRLPRPTTSQERSRKKKSVCSARNDRFLLFCLETCRAVIFLLRNDFFETERYLR
jgi:hypothetical protein